MTYSVQRLLAAIFAVAVTFNACSDLGEPLPGSQSLSTNKIDIGLVTVGFTGDGILTITSGGPGALTGKAAIQADTAGAFNLVSGGSYSLGIGETIDLTIGFSPDSATLFQVGAWLVLESNDASATVDSVELLGEGTLTLLAELGASATTLNFGSLTPDQSDTTLALTINSTGLVLASVTNIEVTGEGFTAAALAFPFDLVVGADTTLNITFTPPALGSYIGSVTITSISRNSLITVDLLGSQSEPVSFAASVLPVLTANCGAGNCHLNGKSQEGLSLETYASLLAGSDNGPVVIAGDGAGSLIIRKLRGTAGTRMPQGNPALPDSTISTIEIWIDQGALDN
ncbi:MAG: choice-of-anchor D domain-containing protein [Candidatus Marinimicrobia bacterium]|nr:choice-of-anchor D domain-containing protein [Candidatus Neomarinimicrobiota bacterium]